MTTLLEKYQPIFMVVTFGFLGFAFYLTYRPRRTTASQGDASRPPVNKMMTFNKIMLWAVTAMAVVFLFFPQIIMDRFRKADAFTADMQRTVIKIEGMT